MKKVVTTIKMFIPEILVLTGIFLFCFATFEISEIYGIYATGIILFLLGMFIAKGRR